MSASGVNVRIWGVYGGLLQQEALEHAFASSGVSAASFLVGFLSLFGVYIQLM